MIFFLEILSPIMRSIDEYSAKTVLAFQKSADVFCGKMSLQSEIFQKMTELERNHKTQN